MLIVIEHATSDQATAVRVTRERLQVQSVSWAMVPRTHLAHVAVSQFGLNVSGELREAIGTAVAQGATGIVPDLRNNPGGLRDEAVAVASQFVADGTILTEEDADGRQTIFPAAPGGIAVGLPLIVLVNDASASSAEIVAGAIQDHARGLIIGTTTAGSGTVLSVFGLQDGSALLLATSRWLTPHGRSIWHRGITPDLEVVPAPGADPLNPDEERAEAPETLARDAQLTAAVDSLKSTPLLTTNAVPAQPAILARRKGAQWGGQAGR